MTENRNRWWEFYLTRYLAGNIFAVLVLFYLLSFYGTGIQHAVCPDNSDKRQCTTQTEVMISCAIDPTAKSVCARSEPKKVCINAVEFNLCEPGKFSSKVFDFIFVTTKDLEFKNNIAATESDLIVKNNSQIKITEINFSNIFILWVLGFLYMAISSIPVYFLHNIRGIWMPYLCLIPEYFRKYSCKNKVINFNKEHSVEYLTSCQHAREHGNAFGIILMEILFAFLLIEFNFSLWLIVLWLLSGFSGWFIGLYLEDNIDETHEQC